VQRARFRSVARVNRRRELLSWIAEAVVIVLLVGGLPMFEGIIVTPNHGGPSITLNICHPRPGLNQGSGFSATPLTPPPRVAEKPALLGLVSTGPLSSLVRAYERPDIPPPKPLA
jgi:hypothetical protein